MSNLEALRLLKDFYNGKAVNARDVSTAFFIVSCALPDDVTMDDMKDFVLNGNRNWEQRKKTQLFEKEINMSKEEKYKFILNLIKNDNGYSEAELKRIGFTDIDEVLKEIVLKGLEVLLDGKISTT